MQNIFMEHIYFNILLIFGISKSVILTHAVYLRLLQKFKHAAKDSIRFCGPGSHIYFK